MANKEIKLPIKSALVPVFYRNFHCLMGACRDSCCTDDWRIAFNKKDYFAIKRALGKTGASRTGGSEIMRRVKSGDELRYAEFRFTNGHCAFHTEEGLCRLQLECGEKVLPSVCRDFPRREFYTPAAKEYTMSPACEGVLQQLWDLPGGVEFEENPLSSEDERTVNIQQGGGLTLCFAPIRALCVDILQNRALPLKQRMLVLGVVLQWLQREDWNAFDPDAWTERIASLLDADGTAILGAESLPGNRDMYLLQNLKVLKAISAHKKGWPAELYKRLEAKQTISMSADESGKLSWDKQYTIQYSRKAYEDALAQFQAAFSDREYFFENLMVAVALYLQFPNLTSKEALWKSYVALCSLYSFFRFTAVLGCKDEATKERFFHMIVMASRATLHNTQRLNGFQEDLFQHDSSTLAHMAILLD